MRYNVARLWKVQGMYTHAYAYVPDKPDRYMYTFWKIFFNKNRPDLHGMCVFWWPCVCVYVCMYVFMYVCMRKKEKHVCCVDSKNAGFLACTYIHTYIHRAYVWLTWGYIHARIHTCAWHDGIHIHTYIHTYIQMSTHTYKQTDTHRV